MPMLPQSDALLGPPDTGRSGPFIPDPADMDPRKRIAMLMQDPAMRQRILSAMPGLMDRFGPQMQDFLGAGQGNPAVMARMLQGAPDALLGPPPSRRVMPDGMGMTRPGTAPDPAAVSDRLVDTVRSHGREPMRPGGGDLMNSGGNPEPVRRRDVPGGDRGDLRRDYGSADGMARRRRQLSADRPQALGEPPRRRKRRPSSMGSAYEISVS